MFSTIRTALPCKLQQLSMPVGALWEPLEGPKVPTKEYLEQAGQTIVTIEYA